MLLEKVLEKRQKTEELVMGQTVVEVLKVRNVKDDLKAQTGVVAEKARMITEMVQTRMKPEDFRGC